MSYRDVSSRARSPPPPLPTQHQPPTPTFDDFDDPPSPEAGGYGNDRIQNDLLDEICSDIGIKDAIDLDVFDFDVHTDQYIIQQNKLTDELLGDIDQTIPFGSIEAQQQQASAERIRDDTNLIPDGAMDGLTQIPSFEVTNQKSLRSDQSVPLGPRLQRPGESCSIASPTISSSCNSNQATAGSSNSRPSSASDASADSPAVHSTTSSGGDPKGPESREVDVDKIKEEKYDYLEEKSTSDDQKVLERPGMLSRLNSHGSLGSPVSSPLGPPSVEAIIKSETSLRSSSGQSSQCLSPKPVTSCMSQPQNERRSDSPFKQPSAQDFSYRQGQGPRGQSSRPAGSQNGGTDQGYYSVGSPSVCTGSSQYGSSTNLSSPPDQCADSSKDKVMRYLGQDKSTAASLYDPMSACTSAATSQSNSPTQEHAAKRPRIISNGCDLLEEMRERYSFVKGADMYAPPSQPPSAQHSPNVPVQKPRMAPQPYKFPNQVNQNTNFNFGQTATQFGATPTGNNRSTSQNHGQQTQSTNGSYNNQNCSFQTPQQQQQQNPSCAMNSSQNQGDGGRYGGQTSGSLPRYPQSSAGPYVNGNQGNQSGMYSSCPDLSPPRGVAMGDVNYQQQQQQNMNMNNNCGPLQGQENNGYSQQQQYGSQSSYGGSSQVPVAQARMYPGSSQQQQQQQGLHRQLSVDSNSSCREAGGYGSMSPLPSPAMGPSHRTPVKGMGTPSSMSAPNTPSKYPAGRGMNIQGGQRSCQMQGGDGAYTPVAGNMQNRPPMRNQFMGQQQPMGEQGQPGNMQMRGGAMGNERYDMNVPMNSMQNQQMHNGPHSQPMTPGQGPGHSSYDPSQGLPNPPMTPQGQMLPGPGQEHVPLSQHGFMQHLINDRSSAFRSHPLFPLLRDLIIADMNFHSPSFPFALIANLPADFDRLLQNYLARNPPMGNYTGAEAVKGVIMDALKYAHTALIEKIKSRKLKEGYEEPAKPLSAIEDFCERFDRAVKNTIVAKNDHELHGMAPPHPDPGMPPGPPQMAPGSQPGYGGGGPQFHPPPNPMGPPQDYPLNQHPPHYPHHDKPMPFSFPPHLQERRSQSLPPSPRKPMRPLSHERLDSMSDFNIHMAGKRSHDQTTGTTTGKNKVLPKEAVQMMLDWLRKHQDNPYPNDDEKEMLIQKTKLTINQINYWFTNARRRILPKWALQRYMEQQEKQKEAEKQKQPKQIEESSSPPLVGSTNACS